ncbi:16S rRNA (guanine(966)-N(2))-methyltransferase RsmD [Methylopila turkensis]|uniref:DNA methyltransferase n=1 Tax=Methylopila turkensis TaxID=1437816 RepID=A0A9W6JLS5_9HYPH|nr:16S rRNA (guanine(966)-N(2))-methyltransferase RsmD [Methylopila turkensis]GLK78756.1 DNA methyltransferase [Methylopila turkensis]
MRIVGGKFKGRALKGPAADSRAIRPTTDRLREALFNVLAHAYGDPADGARTLDLFAGTGALGIEALSRGARYALFVDEGAEARACLRANVEAFGLGGVSRIARRDATHLGSIGAVAPFDLVFADPPYGRGLGERAIASAHDGGWLTPGALVVWEEAADADVATPAGFEELETRAYGDTKVMILRASPPA